MPELREHTVEVNSFSFATDFPTPFRSAIFEGEDDKVDLVEARRERRRRLSDDAVVVS